MSPSVEYPEAYLAHRTADLNLLEAVIGQLKLEKGMRLLDFGCGTGNYLLALQERGYTDLYALDRSDRMCDIAASRTGVVVKVGSHLQVPFEADFFDGIMLVLMIHFVDDLGSLFGNLHRVCKRGGRVVIATQSHDQVDARFYNRYFPTLAEVDKKRYHKPERIVAAAREAGFIEEAVQDYSSGTDMMVDQEYFQLVADRSFFVFRLLPDDEFDRGVELLKLDLQQRGGSFVAPFAGCTLVTLLKDGSAL